MTANIDLQAMSTGPKSGPAQTLTTDKDDPHIIWERCGCRCYICGKIVHPHGIERAEDDMLTYPPHPDHPPNFGVVICGNCFDFNTNDHLDKCVQERQERQQALEQDPGDYEQNRERAFERDDHTCQLCGKEGYPKTQRGLVAYPVRAGNHHLDNLVTICNDCITDTLDSDEDEQQAADRLRLQAAHAKEWVNADDERPDEDQNEQ